MSRDHVAAYLLALLVAGCAAGPDEPDEPADTFPEFTEDCGSAANDTLETAAGLEAEDEATWEGIRLCTDDLDYYRIDVPPHRWLSLTVFIDGDGAGQTDLDLWAVDGDDAAYWGSASGQPFERIAFYNPGDEPLTKYVRVEGWDGGRADYDLLMRVDRYHDELDCDDAYDDEDPADEDGPCNRIMQFPQAEADDDGYLVTHQAHYSNLRREVQYLVRYAARRTAEQFGDTEPLGLLDMSQADGDTPGRMEGQLRHPENTHRDGNDIDIAYYSLSEGNEGKIICPTHDGYFCTSPATDLDVDRTTYFLAMLVDNFNVRVMGVDPEVAALVHPRALEMQQEGLLTSAQRQRVQGLMAYGSGWAFHHHHIHLSWEFEGGHEERGEGVEGCALPGTYSEIE